METLGGYRIIRKLGSGSRSDVYLGHAASLTGGEAALAAIKVFRPGVTASSIEGEIGALSRLRHPHIVKMLDLATGPFDTPCLVLQRLGAGGLPALFADGNAIAAGEAVTILAPLVSAVSAMHGEGAIHGRLGASVVLFDDIGSPVIAGFGAAGCFAAAGDSLSAAALDAHPGVRADRHALVALVNAVIARIPPLGAVAEFSRWLGGKQPEDCDLAELEHRLFTLAEPLPVAFLDQRARATERSIGLVPGRLATSGGGARVGATATPPGKVDWLSVLPPEIATWVRERRADAPQWIAAQSTAVRAQIRSVRRSVWVVACLGSAAVVAAMLFAGLAPDRTTAKPEGRSVEAPLESTSSVTAGDDPVVAARELLATRARCLADLSILCLDSVHAPDSAAWQTDASLIRGVQEGNETTQDHFDPDSTVTLVDRLGQTALLTLTHEGEESANTSASVLMIRTEAGWRFRSLLADSALLDGQLP